MKNTKFFTSKSSLLAVGLLSASAALMAMPATAESVNINLTDKTNSNTSNYPTVSVTLDDTSNPGKITATVKVVPGSTGYIGDLRGVYFNIPGVSGLAISPVSGGPLTNISTDGAFKGFSNSANLNGTGLDFNAGVEVGKQGISKGDDYQSTTFTISGNGLTLSAFSSQTVGARLMSVGAPGGSRDLSSKTAGSAPEIVASNPGGSPSTPGGGETETPETPAPEPNVPAGNPAPNEPSGTPAPSNPGPGGDAEQVPEPATMAGSALGLAALMKWRKNRKTAKSN